MMNCPFCDREEPVLIEDRTTHIFYMHCNRCGCRGPCSTDKGKVAGLWDIRGGPTKKEITAVGLLGAVIRMAYADHFYLDSPQRSLDQPLILALAQKIKSIV